MAGADGWNADVADYVLSMWEEAADEKGPAKT